MTSAVRLARSGKGVEFDKTLLDRLPADAPLVDQIIGAQTTPSLSRLSTQSKSYEPIPVTSKPSAGRLASTGVHK
jgi:hypothetical protein